MRLTEKGQNTLIIPLRWTALAWCGTTLAAAGGVVIHQHGLTLSSGILLLYLAVFAYIAVVDLDRMLIPNVVVLPAIPLCLALFPFSPAAEGLGLAEGYLRSLAGTGFGLLLAIFIASRGRMGAGDVKLAALLGATLGFPHVIGGLFLGFVAGGLVALTLVALGMRSRTDVMPYGPVLVACTSVMLLAGDSLYAWYVGLLR